MDALKCATPGRLTVKLLYGVACQLVMIFAVLQMVWLLWSHDVRKSS
jgi:hypothetical protein